MNDKITEKVALSINKAMSIAKDNQSPDVDVPHLLRALYDDEGSLFCNILQKENISKNEATAIAAKINRIKKDVSNLIKKFCFIYRQTSCCVFDNHISPVPNVRA